MLARLTAILILCTSSVAIARPAPGSFAPLVETLSPAVVNISTKMLGFCIWFEYKRSSHFRWNR